jgi:epsilon-lactone hydrolase
MQPETRTEQRNAVGANVRHSLSETDREAVAAMRKEVAPFKGKMGDPSARPPFDEVMEHTPDARGVTYEKAAVGGVHGASCTPQGARRGAKILYLHGGAYVLGSADAYRHFAGRPPIQLHVGTSEVLLDDTRRYAEIARAAGVEAVAHVWEGMTHVFPTSVGTLDAAEKALGLMAIFLDERLGARPEAVGSPKVRGQA